ncbi:MAG: type 1 glutamine amidotransferase domain-containing protein [Terriglobales bacterium]
MVLTSHDVPGNTGRKTGFWLEEFAAPYFVFRDVGVQLTLASPRGGQPPLDPKSDLPESRTPAMTRFKQDQTAQKALSQTVKLADFKSEDYDTVFYVGGHGPMWDLAESPVSIALLESFYNSGKPIALVCHSPGVLRHVTYQGAPHYRTESRVFDRRSSKSCELARHGESRLGVYFNRRRHRRDEAALRGPVTTLCIGSATLNERVLCRANKQQS